MFRFASVMHFAECRKLRIAHVVRSAPSQIIREPVTVERPEEMMADDEGAIERHRRVVNSPKRRSKQNPRPADKNARLSSQ